jgi:hypothetical protein
MPDAEEVLNNFMLVKNKEILGEKVETVIENDDNFLDDPLKTKNTFSNESISKDDKALLVARKVMNTLFTIPIFIGGIFSVFYILIKIGPMFLSFIRGLFLGLFI